MTQCSPDSELAYHTRRIEQHLWDAIDLMAATLQKPDPRVWSVLDVYRPTAAQPSASSPDSEEREALRRLYNEVSGCWSSFEYELRPIISNTNYACVQHKLDAAKAILDHPAPAQAAPEAPGYSSGLTYGDGYKRGLEDAHGAPQRAGATEEQIQAGCRAMCSLNAIRQFQKVDFDKLDIREREHWEDLARVCLTVALPAAPLSRPSQPSVEKTDGSQS